MTINACKEIRSSLIGQATSSQVMTHQVPNGQEKIIVLRCERNHLCPNTGVLTTLLVNGKIATQGILESLTDAIQCNAIPGDIVVAVATLYPLMNSVRCVELGNATVTLSECDAVITPTASMVPELINTSGWASSCNKKLPNPDEFQVHGTVELPNPLWTAKLIATIPQGLNPEILMLDIVLSRKNGPIVGPQVVVQQNVQYERTMNDCPYKKVHVFYNKQLIADIPVKEVL
jgi:hypothetical protein